MSGWGSSPWGGGTGFGSVGDVTPDPVAARVPVGSTPEQPTARFDLELDVDGDLVVDTDVHFTSGLQAVTQEIMIRLKTFRGEWFLDLDEGVPYYQDLLGQKYNEVKARTAFRNEIQKAPYVTKVISLEVSFDRATRELRVSFKAQTIFGVTEEELVMEI